MIFAAPYVEKHGTSRLHEVVEFFIEKGLDENAFGSDCFPSWFSSVLTRCPTLRGRFETLWTCISKKPSERQQIRDMWNSHVKIEKLTKDTSCPTVFCSLSAETTKAISKLFNYLYDDALKLKKIKTTCGDIDEHYQKFLDGQAMVCPFCSFVYLPDPGCGYRSAYDHFLCRQQYPLLAVCFKNLVPMCDHCNGPSQKGKTDILNVKGTRRPAYYPFGDVGGVTATMAWRKRPAIDCDGECEVTVAPVKPDEADKVGTWVSVFRIRERAASRIRTHQDTWLREFLRNRFSAKPSVTELREAFRAEADCLGTDQSIRTELNATFKRAFFTYYAVDASDTEIAGLAAVITTATSTPQASLTE